MPDITSAPDFKCEPARDRETLLCAPKGGHMSQSTETLWNNFCWLRLQSPAYRAVDDPIVARAYNDWLASYLAESAAPKASNVFPFRKPGAPS